jgi:hypothetical protein
MDGTHSPELRVARPSPRAPRLALLAFGLVLAVVVLEIALRLVPRAISPRLLVLFEPGLRARIASGAFPLQQDFREIARDDGGAPLFVANPRTRIVSIDEAPGGAERVTDELGFCNPPGRYGQGIDVLALGDSFSWCHAVTPDRAWPARLGEKTGHAVYSLGRGGTGLHEYLQFLREFGLATRPRVVVMNVYGGNDLRDAEAHAAYRDAVARGEEPPTENPRPIAPDLLASFAGRHSYALNLALAAASRLSSRGSGDWERTGVDFRYVVEAGGRRIDFNLENRDRDEVVTALRLARGELALSLWDAPLERLASLARQHGFRAVVAYTPSAHVAYRDSVAFGNSAMLEELLRLDDAQRRHLSKQASALGFAFHDLTADLRANAATGELLYDPVHLHLTERGNDVVAESLSRVVRPLVAAGPSH